MNPETTEQADLDKLSAREYLRVIDRKGILKQKGTMARRRAASIAGKAMKGTPQAVIRARKGGKAKAETNALWNGCQISFQLFLAEQMLHTYATFPTFSHH